MYEVKHKFCFKTYHVIEEGAMVVLARVSSTDRVHARPDELVALDRELRESWEEVVRSAHSFDAGRPGGLSPDFLAVGDWFERLYNRGRPTRHRG